MLPPFATVKRSPVILIRTLAFIELAFLAVYLLATLPDAYKLAIFNKLFFAKLFSYNTFKLFSLSAIQLAMTVFAFMRWYYESYSVHPDAVSHHWGVLFKRHTAISLHAPVTVTTSQGFLGRLLHYGTIRVQDSDGNSIVIADISRHYEFLEAIERAMDPLRFRTVPDIQKLIAAEEHERLEFKSSLRFDRREGRVNRALEKAVMKTIAAFLNTKGGHLVIGVDERRALVGLIHDYETLQHASSDGFENHFTQVFNAMVGPEFRHLVKLWFHPVNEVEICVVQVAMSPRPIYLSFDGTEEFFVRTGNTTTALKLSEIDAYRRSRWPVRAY